MTIKVIINKRDIRKRIAIYPLKDGFKVTHDMPEEAIVCEVPTLEIASVIVRALRDRAYVKAAEVLLSKHQHASVKKALHNRVQKYKKEKGRG